MHFRTLCRILVVALAAALLQALPTSPALAAPAQPRGLTPSGTTVSGQPVLAWSRVSGAVRYDVQLSTTDSFTSTLYTSSTTNRRATPTANLPHGDLHWRVRGVSAAGVAGTWAATSFIASRIAGPTLQPPPDDNAPVGLDQPHEPALLSWSPVRKAISYTVEVATNDKFTSAKSYTSKTASFVLPDPLPEQTYHWRVKGEFSGGLSTEWSTSPSSFTINGIATPTLTAPLDIEGGTTVTDAVLDWEPVPGAVKYEVNVHYDDQFTQLFAKEIVKSTRYAPPVTYNNDQYWWRVRAIDVNGRESQWAQSNNFFQRDWPERPQLIHPADTLSTGNPFYYEWSPVEHASHYQLEVSRDRSFTQTHPTYRSCLTKATTYATRSDVDRCHPAAGGLYYWRVRGLDGPRSPAVNGIYSPIHSFSYQTNMVAPISPYLGETVDVPTLRWHPYPQAEKYNVKLYKANGSQAASVISYSPSWTPTGSLRLKADDGPFTWTVQAVGKDGSLTQLPLLGGNWTFQVTGNVVDDEEVVALTPTNPSAGAVSMRFPELAWEPYFDGSGAPAAYYKIHVGSHGTNSFTTLNDLFPYSAGSDKLSDFLIPGQYDWFVTAHSETGGVLDYGRTSMFEIGDLPGVSGQRLSLTGEGFASAETTCAASLVNPVEGENPICGYLQQTPVLQWDPEPNTAFYMVYLARDRELTNLVYDPVRMPEARTSNTMWTPTELLEDNQAGTAYYWYIRPCKATGICGPDPASLTNAATNAFDKRSNPVSGLTARQHDEPDPLRDADQDDADPPTFQDEVVLSWEPYLTTNQGGNGRDATTLPSTVEARSYRVQISTQKTFPPTSETQISPLIDQTTYTPYLTTLPEETLYWRVQAVDGTGNSLAWSTTSDLTARARSMKKESEAPTIQYPGDRSVVAGTPYLRWSPKTFAATYQVEVYKGADKTYSLANRVSSGTTKQPAFAPNVVLSPDDGPYLWRVRRLDVDNRPGAWSERTFSVKGGAPAQVYPRSSAYVSGRDAYFSWRPQDDAVSYRFERRQVGGASSQEIVSTVGHAWAPTTVLADGAYEWRVSAYNSTNVMIGVSPWRSFRVDSTAPRVVGKSPLRRPALTTNFVVKLSEPVRGISTRMALYVQGRRTRLPARVTVTNGGKTATLNPTYRLARRKTYTLKLLPGIRDRAGNALRSTYWRVTTR